jgi:hypothetical protein
MTDSAFPRRAERPSCAYLVRPEMEGVGNAGCPLHPQPRARSVVSTRVSHHGRTGITRHSRTRWFYSLFRALPGDRAFLSPSPADNSADFTPTIEASGPHDFAVHKPALRQQRRSHPSHPNLTFVTIAKRPLCVGRDGEGYKTDLGPKGSIISDFPK